MQMADSSEIIAIAVKFDDCYQKHRVAHGSKWQLKERKRKKHFQAYPKQKSLQRHFVTALHRLPLPKVSFKPNMKH